MLIRCSSIVLPQGKRQALHNKARAAIPYGVGQQLLAKDKRGKKRVIFYRARRAHHAAKIRRKNFS